MFLCQVPGKAAYGKLYQLWIRWAFKARLCDYATWKTACFDLGWNQINRSAYNHENTSTLLFLKKKSVLQYSFYYLCQFFISFSALLVGVISLQTEGNSAKSDTHFKLVLELILGIAWVQHQNYHDWCYLASNINDASWVLMLPRPGISAVSNLLMCNPQTLICKTFTKNRKGRETQLSKENLSDARKISCCPK